MGGKGKEKRAVVIIVECPYVHIAIVHFGQQIFWVLSFYNARFLFLMHFSVLYLGVSIFSHIMLLHHNMSD